VVHHGDYSVEINANVEYVYMEFASEDTIYVRKYVRWTTNPAVSGTYQLGWAGTGATSTTCYEFGVYNDGGTIKWHIHTGAEDKRFDTPNPTTNTWYCAEIKWVRNTLNGITVYIDGSSIGTCDSTTANVGCTHVAVGTYSGMPGGGTTYYDCITLDDSGPLGEDDPKVDDEFESGDFGEWTGTTVDANCAIEVIRTDPREGINHGRSYVTSTNADYARVYKNLSPTLMNCYARVYVKYDVLPSADTHYYCPIDMRGSIGQVQLLVFVYNDSGSVEWRLYYMDGASQEHVDAATGPSADTWYCLEAWYLVDPVYGKAELWVDGVSTLSASNKDTNNRGPIDRVTVGEAFSNGGTEHSTIFDSVVIQEFGPVGEDDFVFVDGFEDGDDTFPNWDARNNFPEVTTEGSLLGSYCARFDSTEFEYIYKNVTAGGTYYSRVYYKYINAPSDGNSSKIMGQYHVTGGYWLNTVYLQNNSGTLRWHLNVWEAGSSYHNYYSTTPEPIENTWFCVELQWIKSTASGSKLYVDGTAVCTSGTTGGEDVERIQIMGEMRQLILLTTLLSVPHR